LLDCNFDLNGAPPGTLSRAVAFSDQRLLLVFDLNRLLDLEGNLNRGVLG
jgi:hypothetical protein